MTCLCFGTVRICEKMRAVHMTVAVRYEALKVECDSVLQAASKLLHCAVHQYIA
jgi:hypothetical protein